MPSKQELQLAVLLALGLIFAIGINANLSSKAENHEFATAVFYVA